jgi:uncharacterized protein YqcC (DUF446 family)
MYTKQHPNHQTLDSFHPKCIQLLNQILKQDDHLDIVISSDWKYWVSLPEMQDFYRQQGIVKIPIAYTPYTPKYTWEHYPEQRSHEILTYIQDHNITEWVAVDDMNMSRYLSNFIHIDNPRIGIKHDNISQIIQILSS